MAWGKPTLVDSTVCERSSGMLWHADKHKAEVRTNIEVGIARAFRETFGMSTVVTLSCAVLVQLGGDVVSLERIRFGSLYSWTPVRLVIWLTQSR